MKRLVHIVDDDATTGLVFGAVLEGAGYAVRYYASAERFLSAGEDAGVMLLDQSMPGRSGLELARQMRDEGYSMPIIFLTSSDDAETARDAMLAGAVNYLPKPVAPADVLDAVRQAGVVGERRREAARLRQSADQQLSRLTRREREVFRLLCSGLQNKQVASRLGICERTVESHRASITAKVGSKKLPDLVRLDMVTGGGVP